MLGMVLMIPLSYSGSPTKRLFLISALQLRSAEKCCQHWKPWRQKFRNILKSLTFILELISSWTALERRTDTFR